MCIIFATFVCRQYEKNNEDEPRWEEETGHHDPRKRGFSRPL